MNYVTMWEFEELEENLHKKKKEIFMFLFKSNFLANERIIGRISFIDCVNMKSRIMILVKVWYEWINLIKIFEWERVCVCVCEKKWCDILVNPGEAARPTPQHETLARAQSSGDYTVPEFIIDQYVFLSD